MSLGARQTTGRIGAAALLALVLVAGCGSSGGKKAAHPASGGSTPMGGGSLPSKTGPIGSFTDGGGSPVDGGTMHLIVDPTDPGGLDPITNLGSGETGLTELTAIYDSLMRYDPVANKYVPQLAESLTSNANHTVYTLKLRANVKFSDGTPLNAAAVVSGFKRFSGPGSVLTYAAIFPEIVKMQAPDDLTVVMTLDGPDTQFPFLLTLGFGQVPSPTAIAREGQKGFNLKPVGAGPFMVKSYKPGVSLSLVRNPNYWGPRPHLDALEFTWVADNQARVQALQSGDVDATIVTNPIQAAKALKNGARGFGWLNYENPVVSMNMRKGRPFADQNLRLAVAYALNPEIVNTRAYGGLGYPSKEFFPAGLLHSGAPGIPTDLAKARKLVADAKAAGWNGSFTLLSSPEPAVHASALAVQAMLNNVGFNATVETPTDWVNRVYVNFNYDAVVTATGFVESDPYVFLVYENGGPYSPTGLQDKDLSAAILELRGASTNSEISAATTKIQDIWNKVVPEVPLAHGVDRMFISSKVHGLVPSASVVTLFDKAWLSH